jgi:DNA-directed RNA polymerase sigma subunit (sigma70/sigma32)
MTALRIEFPPLDDAEDAGTGLLSEAPADAELDELELPETLDVLVRNVARFPLLTPAKEKRLARRSAEGDEQAHAQLILSNLRLVISIAKRYRGQGVPFLDLIQEGYLGPRQVREALEAPGEADATNRLDLEDGEELAATIADESLHELKGHAERSRQARAAREALETLGPRAKLIPQLRFGFCGQPPLALRQVSALTGLSRERVRLAESDALAQLGPRLRHLLDLTAPTVADG